MPRLGTLLQARRAARGLLADRSSHWRPQWLGGALRCDGGRLVAGRRGSTSLRPSAEVSFGEIAVSVSAEEQLSGFEL